MNFYLHLSSLVTIEGLAGYLSIFSLMFLESSFFPFPSELVMIPAGYLASLGQVNLWLSIILGITGSLLGAWFNYFLAAKFGRKLILKFISKKRLRSLEDFFEKHGPISTFNGRLIPVVRQYISLPAGLAKMSPWKFTLYTLLGATTWVTSLALLGYYLGENRVLLHRYYREAIILALIFLAILSLIYFYWYKKRNAKKDVS